MVTYTSKCCPKDFTSKCTSVSMTGERRDCHITEKDMLRCASAIQMINMPGLNFRLKQLLFLSFARSPSPGCLPV